MSWVGRTEEDSDGLGQNEGNMDANVLGMLEL